jgi:hypothetical protein
MSLRGYNQGILKKSIIFHSGIFFIGEFPAGSSRGLMPFRKKTGKIFEKKTGWYFQTLFFIR